MIHLDKKYHFLIFFLVILVTAFLAYFSQAYNPDKYKDSDNDGLTDYEEKTIYQTFWYDNDTDNDGFMDGNEVANGYSPKQADLKMADADTDNDGLNDDWEIKLGTNLMIRDTDGDGYLDGSEVYHGFSPTNPLPEKMAKQINVNITDFNLAYYQGDVMLDSFKISTGKPSTPTPLGDYTITKKYPLKHYYNYPNTKWNLLFHRKSPSLGYYIHGAYWHEKFGNENVSGGCVNVPYDKMERLYNWANHETKIFIE